jgi:hypothetical protein
MPAGRIRPYLLRLYSFMLLFGLDPRKTLRTLRELPRYLYHFVTFRQQQKRSSVSFRFGKLYPCLEDRLDSSGTAKGHYFHQDLSVARKIFKNNPTVHVDVGSRIDGFVAHVASFRSIEVLDIRPLENVIPKVKFLQCDLMGSLPASLVNYCDSLSCLHALEHFGLGRYGDPINPDGHLVGFDNLHGLVQLGGTLYFSVPIGPQRIEFNAHRVFSVKYLLELMADRFRIESFSFVNDEGDFIEDAELTQDLIDGDCGCYYGCGIFELTKIA